MTCLPDRARGSASRIVFQDETCWGEVSADEQPVGLDFTSETVRNPIARIESQIIRSTRMRRKNNQGNQRPGGDILGELQPNTWSRLLRHALSKNSEVTTSGSGPYTHSFRGEVNLDEGVTFEKRFDFRDADAVLLQYIGSRVNEFFIQGPNEGVIACRVGIIAKREVDLSDLPHAEGFESLEASLAAEYATDNDPFNVFHCSLEVDGEAVAIVRSWDLLINNNMDGESFCYNQTAYRSDLSEDVRSISGNLVAKFTREGFDLFYPAFINNDTMSLRFRFERGDQVWDILLPAVTVGGDSVTPTIPGRGPLDLNLQFDAHEDDEEGTDIIVEITNDESSLATAV